MMASELEHLQLLSIPRQPLAGNFLDSAFNASNSNRMGMYLIVDVAYAETAYIFR